MKVNTHSTAFLFYKYRHSVFYSFINTSGRHPITLVAGTRAHAMHARATNTFHSISMLWLHSVSLFSSTNLMWWICSCIEERANPPEIPGIQIWTLGTESIRTEIVLVGPVSLCKSCRNPPCKQKKCTASGGWSTQHAWGNTKLAAYCSPPVLLSLPLYICHGGQITLAGRDPFSWERNRKNKRRC